MDSIIQQMPVTPAQLSVSVPVQKPLEGKGRIISIVSVKGGVGKTTIAANLGLLFSKYPGERCLLVDGDLSLPNVGFHLDIMDPDITLHEVLKGEFHMSQAVHILESGLHVIPGLVADEGISSKGMREGIMQLAPQYNWILIDTTPSLDENLKNIVAFSDEIIVVSSPDFPSITASMKAVRMAAEIGVPVKGIVLNKVHNKAYELDVKEIEETLNVPVLGLIPDDQMVYESLSQRRPVVLYSPSSPAAKKLRMLADKLAGREKKSRGFSAILLYLKGLFGR
jgi:septum site-determining protein MinD